MKPNEVRQLLAHAEKARELAHAPYSRYRVGAALLTPGGNVWLGANVENASLGLSVCAERTAIWKAVTDGERQLLALAIATADGGAPCGACRQVILEFAPDAWVIWRNARGRVIRRRARALLLEPFLSFRPQRRRS